MKLTEYLAVHGIGLGEFARKVGAKNARTIQRYTKHGRVPSGPMMVAIVRETGGAVQPNDFFPAVGER